MRAIVLKPPAVRASQCAPLHSASALNGVCLQLPLLACHMITIAEPVVVLQGDLLDVITLMLTLGVTFECDVELNTCAAVGAM
jgi:hypothetical protein